MIKKLFRILVVLVLLLVIGIVVAWLYVDHLAAKMLTGGIRYAGQVPCEVNSVGVSLLSGSVRVDELTVGNPRGFAEEDMFTLGRAEVSARVGSFWNRPLHIHNLAVIAPVLRVEPGPGGTNVAVFLGNVKGKAGADDEPSARQERVLVDRLLIKDAVVRIGSGIGPPSLLDVELETVELKDIHGRDGRGVSTAELAAVIVLELVRRGVIKADLDMEKFVPIDVIKGVDAVARSAGDVIKSAGDLLTIPLDKLVPRTRPADEPPQR